VAPAGSRISVGLGSLVVLVCTLAGACAEEEAPLDNGVNDVRKACEIRLGWTNAGSDKCALCQASAPRPACGCEAFKGFDGVCVAQGDARRAEASCTTELASCVTVCDDADCACIESCYAAAPACKRAAAAQDGCVADKCAAFCN
jgi:hypothetical protein